MDENRFERFVRAFATSGGRRALVRVLAATGLAGAAKMGTAIADRRGNGRHDLLTPAGKGKKKRGKKKKKKTPCRPRCNGKACGPNGCQGTCGTCSGDTVCDAAGQCVGCLGGEDCEPRICNDVACQSGVCTYSPVVNDQPCGPSDICCDGACIDRLTDPNNCGSCGNRCEGSEACHDGVCCAVCADGCPYRSVLDAVRNAAPDATIRICPGAYAAYLFFFQNLTLVGMGAGIGETELRPTPGARTIEVPEFKTVTIRNLTITGLEGEHVAAVLNGGSLTLDHVEVRGNTADPTDADFGGGILNTDTLTLIDSVVSFNSAKRGGGIMNGGTATLTRSFVESNVAVEGGGVFNFPGSDLILNEGTRIRSNQSGSGGGGGVYNEGTVTLNSGSSILGNTPDQCVNAGGTGCPA